MWSIMRLSSLLICLVIIGTLMAACGGASNPAAGTYKGIYTKFVGDDDDAKVTDEVFSLELKGDGTGIHHRDDLDINVTWTLDGEKFTMQETFMGIKLDYTGTLVNGKLDIFNGDPEDIWSCEYVYEKQ